MVRLPPYDIFPEMSSGDLVLKQVEPNDIQDLVEISFYDAKPAQTLEEAIVMQNRINADYQNGSSIHWCIMNKTTGRVMGTLGYYRGFANNTGELGCVLKQDFRGQGIMAAAIKLAAEFGTDTMGLKAVVAITTKQNIKAINLLERLHFIKIRELEEQEVEYRFQKSNP
jgi:[ribosomal protein S5]-alanine N-acetyltransferase